MGLFDTFKVNIHAYLRNQVFYPGNVVEGYVDIGVSSPVPMVAIRVKACGKEKVYCRRETGSGEHRRVITRSQTNVIYKQLLTLAGQLKKSRNRSSVQLPAGKYSYPFMFQLPVALPPSFVKRAGDDSAQIMYFIKAYVDIPNGKDAVCRTFFTVVRAMPQGQWIQRNPVSVERDWAVTCCCCISKGSVHGQLFMDRTMIAIDRDNLTVCANIDNTKGENPVESIEISLMHMLRYTAGGMTENNTVCEGKQFIKQGVAAGQKGQISGTIPLPRTIIPTLATWNVTSEYFIQIELNIPWASDPDHKFPVVIAQSVDPTNTMPPVSFAQCAYKVVQKEHYPEYYYQPPPKPVYQFNPIPLAPPPNADMWQFSELNCQIPLPPDGWLAPPPMGGGQAPPPAQGIQWNQGFQSQQHGFGQDGVAPAPQQVMDPGRQAAPPTSTSAAPLLSGVQGGIY